MTPFMPGGAADGGHKLATSLDTSNADAAAPMDNKAAVKAFGKPQARLVFRPKTQCSVLLLDDSDDEFGTQIPTDPLLATPWGDDKKARARAIRAGMVYELYSVLIHSGSALGGHYYAYIK